MRRIIGFIVAIISVSSFAETFVATTSWNCDASKQFSSLETLGVAMNSLEDALNQCRGNNEKCVLKSNEILYDDVDSGRRELTYKTVVQSIDEIFETGILKKSPGSYIKKSTRYGSYTFDTLEHLGIRYEALSSALNSCYEDGNDYCAIQNSEITESNNMRLDSKKHSTAKASVRGYKLKTK